MGCEKMVAILEGINHFVWGVPALVLILGVGIYLSFSTGFAQLALFPRALRIFSQRLKGKSEAKDGVSSYQALCTALAATVGTGNLAGVAGAIAIGGPGSIFWMWICGILGMVTKYAEASLAVRYRVRNSKGELVGGPMYMIAGGMGKRWLPLAYLYCFFGVIAAFGVGNATQTNAVIDGINSSLTALGGRATSWGNIVMGVLLAVLVAVMLLGGAKRIASVAEGLVPAAAAASGHTR